MAELVVAWTLSEYRVWYRTQVLMRSAMRAIPLQKDEGQVRCQLLLHYVCQVQQSDAKQGLPSLRGLVQFMCAW